MDSLQGVNILITGFVSALLMYLVKRVSDLDKHLIRLDVELRELRRRFDRYEDKNTVRRADRGGSSQDARDN